MSDASRTLIALAAEINAALRQADSSRLDAGRLLLQAREIFEADKAQGDSWRAWCATNIPDRSYRDIKRVMALARSSNPTAALAKERDEARLRMARARGDDGGTNVRPLATRQKQPPSFAEKAAAHKLYIITPPEARKQFEDEFGPLADVCPYPPPKFDSIAEPWDELFPNAEGFFCNPMFIKTDNDIGHGPMDFARKAIDEHKRIGKNVVFFISAQNGHVANLMMEARAEARSLGRLPWLEATTRDPMPSPPPSTCFILRGKKADPAISLQVNIPAGRLSEMFVRNSIIAAALLDAKTLRLKSDR